MTSKERILAAVCGEHADHVPLTTWCFGFPAPPELRRQEGNKDIAYWYSLRMEHLHALPQAWGLDDDFNRVKAWLSIGIDDVLDVSVPWSHDPSVRWDDSTIPAGQADACPVLVRQYQTPAGLLRHAVRQTGEDPGPGWVIQPDIVPLFEDYNIPRAVEHAVSRPSDVPSIRFLYSPPHAQGGNWFAERMTCVKQFADKEAVFVQAWSAFGADAVVWLAGTEGAVMLAMDQPAAFRELVEIVAETDYSRTELAVTTPGVDMVVQRGWYSSTDFWSPKLFDEFVYPYVAQLAALAHKHGRRFAYVMTTGVKTLGSRLADAGVDVLYFVDPVQDTISLQTDAAPLTERMTLVGGINALTLGSDDPQRIDSEVRQAIDILGPTNRFVLHPVDAIFPDTLREGVERMINARRQYR